MPAGLKIMTVSSWWPRWLRPDMSIYDAASPRKGKIMVAARGIIASTGYARMSLPRQGGALCST